MKATHSSRFLSSGTSQPASSMLKSLCDRIQDVMLCHQIHSNAYKRLDTKLEKKMIELKRNASGNTSFKSMDSIIIKFPRFRDGLKEIRGVFEQYDEDSNRTIDHEELKKCLRTLRFPVREDEMEGLYKYCDMNGDEGIQFNEFIVLMCLTYLLADSYNSSLVKQNICSPKIEDTFNMIIQVFLFLDKNGEGKLKRKDVVKALNDASPREKSPSHVTGNRFKEMDWDRNGRVSFKEFLFSFISWVGLDSDEELLE